MQDYIRNHLDENITMSKLAKVAYYSPWYSYRIFWNYTGLTPADYIRRLRLTKSALKIRDGKSKIIEVANESQFSSPDGFSRAFRKEFGINPKTYARTHRPLTLFTPFGVEAKFKERKELNLDNLKSVFVQLTKRPHRKAIIKRGIKADHYFAYCDEVGCDIFGTLLSIKGLYEPIGMWLPEAMIKKNTSKYVQGVEVGLDFRGEIPAGFEIIELPEAEYLLFQSEPFAEAEYDRAIKELWTAIERYNPETINYEWDKSNPRIQMEPVGTRGYIELLPVKPKSHA